MDPFPALPSLGREFQKRRNIDQERRKIRKSGHEHVLFGIFDLLVDMLHKSART